MSTDWVNRQLGSYRLISLIGRGGYADVYLGEHIYLKTQAAIKVLRTQLTDEDIEHFRTEAFTIAHLVHSHIVRVFDFNVLDNTPFLVMDYAPNGNLRHRHPKGSRLAPETFLPYVMDIASALQYAHDQKLIHRDIKPENMLLGSNNQVMLSDFGIATVSQNSLSQTTEDMVVGTMAYMAPEQLQGKARPASDQYSLAVVVYEWLSGARPFNGTYVELLTQHLSTDPPILDEQTLAIPHTVQQVIRRALAKDPHQRFARIQDFANALEWSYRSAQVTAPGGPRGREDVRPPAINIPTQTTRVYNDPVQARPRATTRPATGPMLSFAAASAPQLTTSVRSVGRGLGRLTRSVLLVLLLGGVLICGGGYAIYNQFFGGQNAASTNQSGATTLSDNFAQAISAQNYDQAYNDLNPGLAQKNQFVQDARSEDQCNGPITTYKRISETARGNTLVETYEITRSKLAKTYHLILTLQGDNSGRWQISDYQSQAPACPSS
jgi:serine/threonine protein kinase